MTGSNHPSCDDAKKKKRNGDKSCKPLKPCKPHTPCRRVYIIQFPRSRPKVIKAPGDYIICGRPVFRAKQANVSAITICSSDVTLNLSALTLQLQGCRGMSTLPAGVIAITIMPDLSNVIVKNGKLRGFSGGGVVAGDPTGANTNTIHNLQISEINTSNVALNAFALYQVTDLTLDALHSDGTIQGERMLSLNYVQTAQITRTIGTGFTSTLGSVVEINNCQNVRFVACDANDNTKAIVTVDTANPNPQMCILSVNSSSNIDFIDCRVNSNQNTTNVSEGITFLGVFSSNSVQFIGTEMQSNIDVIAGAESYSYGFQADTSNDLVIRQCQWSYNGAGAPIKRFSNADFYNCNNPVLEDLLSDYITVPALVVSSSESNLHGIYMTGSVSGYTGRVTRCSTSFISTGSGGAGRTASNFAYLAGLHADLPCMRIEQHMACFNSMGDNQPWTFVEGVEIGGFGGGSILKDSTVCFNTGGQEAYGVVLDYDGSTYTDASKQIVNCVLDFNGNYGLAINFLDDLANAGTDIQIRGSSMNNNGPNVNSTGVSIGQAAGIMLRQLSKGGLARITITDCDLIDNSSSDATSGNSYGVYANTCSNVQIQGCTIMGTGSTLSGSSLVGHGIVMDGCTDAHVSKCTIQANASSGIELDGTNSGIQIIQNLLTDNSIAVNQPSTSSETACTIMGNEAYNNTTSGFVHLSSAMHTAFLRNTAQGNGMSSSPSNFVLAPGQNIQLQTYTVSTGVTMSTYGTMDLGAYLTNLQVVF